MIACRFGLLFSVAGLILSFVSYGQSLTRRTYHDAEKTNLKEVYEVKDTISNIPHGRYVSYYLNGNVESKGQFTNNETTGVWEFFYETGNLKMRGIVKQNANYGLWQYFYESGQKSMEGTINGRNREGEWKTYYENGQIREVGEYRENKRAGLWKAYFEDGLLRGEIDYTDDHGTYTEYYHSGKILGEGPKVGTKNAGHWRIYAEDGTLQSEGDYLNGNKHGEWISYYPDGAVASRGRYEHDQPTGSWEHYFEDGKVRSSGAFAGGVKVGSWQTLNADGSIKSEAHYENGAGDYREYYPGGGLKMKGRIVDGKKEGKWEYFYEDGKREGECEYAGNKGTYYGYFPNGNLRTKGFMEGERKTGTWELYENDGNLSGYYRPFYDDKKMAKEIAALVNSGKTTRSNSGKRNLTYFDARFNEFRGLILEGNPVMVFAGRLPVGIEFYLQERLGHEFEFIGVREPFFKNDLSIPLGMVYDRGYSIAIKQKFYNQTKTGMWYFGHEIRFTNIGHFANRRQSPESIFIVTAIDQRIQWGLLLGYRILQHRNTRGFTIDAFASANAGYRGFDVDSKYASDFASVSQSRLAATFNVGFNFGKVFSFPY